MPIYHELLEKEQDIIKYFDITPESLNGCNILFACYDTGNHDGQALIIYEKDNQLYEVNGSHDSCTGLEGQWEPEETNIEALTHRFKKGNLSYFVEKHGNSVREVLNTTPKTQAKKNLNIK